MKSHFWIALLSAVSWLFTIDAAAANQCSVDLSPATSPPFALSFRPSSLRPAPARPVATLLQKRQFWQAFRQDGIKQVQNLIGSEISLDATTAILTDTSQSSSVPSEDAAKLIAHTVTLLTEEPVSPRSESLLDALAITSAEQNSWATANQATAAIRHPQAYLDLRARLARLAQEQGLLAELEQQQQQQLLFLNRYPSYQAVLWADIAAYAHRLDQTTLVMEATEIALQKLNQAGDSYPEPEQPVTAPGNNYRSHLYLTTDRVARLLGQAQQFEVAYPLAIAIANTGTQLAIAAAQVDVNPSAALSRVLSLEDRNSYLETIDVAYALAASGDINCSLAVFFTDPFIRQLPRNSKDNLAELLLLWMQSGRQDAVLALTETGYIRPSQLMLPWVQLGEGETALTLATNIDAIPQQRYRILSVLEDALIAAGNTALADEVDTISSGLSFHSFAGVPASEPAASPFWLYSSAVDSEPYRTYASAYRRLNYESANIEELTGVKEQLLAVAKAASDNTEQASLDLCFRRENQANPNDSVSTPCFDNDGMLLLLETTLALYRLGANEAAELALQQTLALSPQVFSRRQAQDWYFQDQSRQLLNQYRAAGWYAGAAAWLTHPVMGADTQLYPSIADRVPLSKQGKMLLELAEHALANGNEQAALDMMKYLNRKEDQALMGTEVVAQTMMLRRRHSAATASPNMPFTQTDFLAERIIPIAEALPMSLVKAHVYLAVAQSYMISDNKAKASQWLVDAVVIARQL